MTFAAAVKVYDGIVLAADSTTTVALENGHQLYNSANKIFHLHRRLPIGAMTWGLGNIGEASTATIAKDFRRRLMGHDDAHADWSLDADSYTIEEVADRLIELAHGELYSKQEFGTGEDGVPTGPILGFLVAGYSARASQSEAWLVQFDDPSVTPIPEPAAKVDDSGWMAYAQPEAVVRLLKGFDPLITRVLANHVDESTLDAIIKDLTAGILERPVIMAAMPFADAISLAKYLVDTTVGYTRYILGPDTVGGQVELAGITRHEGFKWISRKHYYSPTLNPKDPGHDY